MIRLWWYFQDTEFLITYRIPGKGHFVLGISGYLLVNANPLVQSLLVWVCSGTSNSSRSLCPFCSCTYTFLHLCAPNLPDSSCTLNYHTSTRVWGFTGQIIVKDVQMQALVGAESWTKVTAAPRAEDTGRGPQGCTTLPALWESTKVPLDSECSLLWRCVHSKQNMGSWTSSPASFK